MDDRAAVAAIVAGDPGGLADAYDRYAASLYGYCRTLLHEPADAADAVQDTFVIAAARVGALRDARKLRPWLYAVARNECLRKLRSREAPAEIEESEDLSEAADTVQSAQRAELRELVRAAISGLNPPDREVIELNLRHDLEGADLAAVLGVSRSHAHAMASRARGQLEKSLGALLVARTGRRACPALDQILADWDGRLTILLRKRVSRHIDQCEECDERKRRALRPAMLFGIPALPMLPPGLRHQMLRLCADRSPAAVDARHAIVRQAGSFGGPSGFPRPLRASRARSVRDPGAGLVAAFSVAAAAAVIIAMIALRGSTPSTLDAKAGTNHGAGVGAVAASSTSVPAPSSGAPSPNPDPTDSMAAIIHPPGTVTTPPIMPSSTSAPTSTPATHAPAHSSSPRPRKSPKPTKSPTHSPSPSPSPSVTSPSPTPTTPSPSSPPPTTQSPTPPPTTTSPPPDT